MDHYGLEDIPARTSYQVDIDDAPPPYIKRTSLTHLPPEILHYIFSFLEYNAHELIRMRQVCTEWSFLLRQNRYWHSIAQKKRLPLSSDDPERDNYIKSIIKKNKKAHQRRTSERLRSRFHHSMLKVRLLDHSSDIPQLNFDKSNYYLYLPWMFEIFNSVPGVLWDDLLLMKQILCSIFWVICFLFVFVLNIKKFLNWDDFRSLIQLNQPIYQKLNAVRYLFVFFLSQGSLTIVILNQTLPQENNAFALTLASSIIKFLLALLLMGPLLLNAIKYIFGVIMLCSIKRFRVLPTIFKSRNFLWSISLFLFYSTALSGSLATFLRPIELFYASDHTLAEMKYNPYCWIFTAIPGGFICFFVLLFTLLLFIHLSWSLFTSTLSLIMKFIQLIFPPLLSLFGAFILVCYVVDLNMPENNWLTSLSYLFGASYITLAILFSIILSGHPETLIFDH